MTKFIMSCDDGCASDVRVAELATKYDIECIFYWPVEHRSLAYENGYKPLTRSEQRLIAEEFEIGSHTLTHRHLTKLSNEEAFTEILDSQTVLKRLFNQNVTKFCPPRGYTNELLTEYTLTFYESQRLTKGEGLVHVHPNSGANKNQDWREYAKNHEVKELWFHSHELDKYDLWDQLEEYLRENTSS